MATITYTSKGALVLKFSIAGEAARSELINNLDALDDAISIAGPEGSIEMTVTVDADKGVVITVPEG